MSDKIDPTNRAEFEAFAVEAVRQNSTNLRRMLDLWHRYTMHCEACPHDLSQDPASRLVVAQLAHQMGLGVKDSRAPHACIKEIQSARH
jgi:hypothetical protein